MNVTKLTSIPGAKRKKRYRVGRGPGSGNGTTAGRGYNGAKKRSGWHRRADFEGGQMPLVRRLPKRGFNNKTFRTEFAVLNVEDLNGAFKDGQSVGPEDFLKAGLINRLLDGVKVLANGDLKVKLNISAHKFSGSAVKKIEAAGGTAVVIANA